jgi:hypothetical protein
MAPFWLSWQFKAGLALVIAGAFAVLAGLVFVRGKDIEVLQAQKSELATQLKSVGDSLEVQNKAVEALKQASIDQASRAEHAARNAQKALGVANARAETLALAKVPTACPDALEWLRLEVVKSAPTQERSK